MPVGLQVQAHPRPQYERSKLGARAKEKRTRFVVWMGLASSQRGVLEVGGSAPARVSLLGCTACEICGARDVHVYKRHLRCCGVVKPLSPTSVRIHIIEACVIVSH